MNQLVKSYLHKVHIHFKNQIYLYVLIMDKKQDIMVHIYIFNLIIKYFILTFSFEKLK